MTPTLNIHHCREQHNIKMGLCNCREENLENLLISLCSSATTDRVILASELFTDQPEDSY